MLQCSWLKHLLLQLDVRNLLLSVVIIWAWCVGCNPPFVVCGIRLIGLPAPLVDCHQRLFALSTCRTAVSPLPNQHGRHFRMPHPLKRQIGRVVSAPLPRLSPYTPKGYCNSTCGRSFLRPKFLGPKATHQLASPQQNALMQPINTSYEK
jgi:hypothetical protein